MSSKYLGQPFDIHGGGSDLIFPHHENEIAQSEGAAGVPLARYWIHHGFVNINREKMSKSLGNFLTIREALDKHDALSLRQYVLSSHYRSPIDFSLQGLEEAERATGRLYDTLERLDRVIAKRENDPALLEEFRAEMDDDLNTPRAMSLVFEEVRALNRLADEGKVSSLGARLAALRTMARVLGLLDQEPQVYADRKRDRWLKLHGLTSEAIEALVRAREQARTNKQWAEADRIRADLRVKGILVEDSPQGTTWKVQ
jgi:cysteinyl-tRNA synthetase